MSSIPPRIRGRAGQGEDGKWYFEISMWDLAGLTMVGGEPIGTYGPWDTEKIAKKEMRKAVEIIVKDCKNPDGESPNGYVDFKNGGVFRSFNEH